MTVTSTWRDGYRARGERSGRALALKGDSMDGYYDKNKKKIMVDGKEYEPKPSMWDRAKEAFEPVQDRAQLEAIRKRRSQMGS